MDMTAQQQSRSFEANLVFDWIADEEEKVITFTKLKSACVEHDIIIEDRTLLQMLDLAEPGDKGDASKGEVNKEEFCERVAAIRKDKDIIDLIRRGGEFDVQKFPLVWKEWQEVPKGSDGEQQLEECKQTYERLLLRYWRDLKFMKTGDQMKTFDGNEEDDNREVPERKRFLRMVAHASVPGNYINATNVSAFKLRAKLGHTPKSAQVLLLRVRAEMTLRSFYAYFRLSKEEQRTYTWLLLTHYSDYISMSITQRAHFVNLTLPDRRLMLQSIRKMRQLEVFKERMVQYKMEATSVAMHVALLLAPCLPLFVGAMQYDVAQKIADPYTDQTSFTPLLNYALALMGIYLCFAVFYMACYYIRGKGQLPNDGSSNGQAEEDEHIQLDDEDKKVKVVPGAGMQEEGPDNGGCVLQLSLVLYYVSVLIVATLSACVTACFVYWVILGTVINPERIVPVAAGVASFTAHFVGFKLMLSGIRKKIFNCIGKYVEEAKKLIEKARKLKHEADIYKKKLDSLAEVAAGGGDLEDAIYQMMAEMTVDKYICPGWPKDKGPLIGLTPFVKQYKMGWPRKCNDERGFAVLKTKQKIRAKIEGEDTALEKKQKELTDKVFKKVFEQLDGKLNAACAKIGIVIGEFRGTLIGVVHKWGLGKAFEAEVAELYDELTKETREDLQAGVIPPRLPKEFVARLQEQIVSKVQAKKKHIEKVLSKMKGAVEAGKHLGSAASKFMMEQGLQQADVLVMLIGSSVVLVLLLAFIMIGVEVFSEPGMTASTVNTVLNLVAGKAVNQNASSPFSPEKVEKWTQNLSKLCSSVVAHAEKEFGATDTALLGMGGGDDTALAAQEAEATEPVSPEVVTNPIADASIEEQKVAV
jgi:hypothetical protein